MPAADLLGPDGPLARAIEGYEHRPSQMVMAGAVEEAIEHEGVLLVEAGTGTGKTLAYLVPALLSGKKVVISTGTRTLQDQIMEHDLPLLKRHLDVPFRAACMKGLSNYLCLRRFHEFAVSAEAAMGPLARQIGVVDEWRQRTVTGDRAELMALAEGAGIWGSIVSGSDTRIGARCSHYEECFITRMRRVAEEANLVVVNHHLFFADLATRGPHGGGVLPDYDVVIFDEAHGIEDVATLFFGVQLSTSQVERLVRDATRTLESLKDSAAAGRLGGALLNAAGEFFDAVPRGSGLGRSELSPEHFRGDMLHKVYALDDALEALESHCRLQVAESESAAQMARRAASLRDDLMVVVEAGEGRRVAWAETRGRSSMIGASPTDVSEILREELFAKTASVVLTSATLSTAGDFNFIKKRLGVDFEVSEEQLPSPFEYAEQAALYLGGHLPDPRATDFLDAAEQEVLSLIEITGGGAFVLCTSFRVMKALAMRCRPELKHPVLVQGEAPKGALLDLFRSMGDAVLFATASFWEGVDVPGEALRLVIMDKLPFEVPTDPLVAARCKGVEEKGENAFMKYLVPSAALTLKQGFGRLIRSGRDRGIVAILDSRIVKKGYGRVFLKSLPDASRCYSLDEVRAFWALSKGGVEGEEG